MHVKCLQEMMNVRGSAGIWCDSNNYGVLSNTLWNITFNSQYYYYLVPNLVLEHEYEFELVSKDLIYLYLSQMLIKK